MVDGAFPRPAAKELHEAARAGDSTEVARRVAEGVDVHATTLRGQTALMLAAGSTSRGTVESVTLLLGAAARVDDTDDAGWTALHHACRNSQGAVVEMLLTHRASMSARAKDGKTACMLAAMDSSEALVLTLYQLRASVDARDGRGWPLLFYACEEHCLDLVHMLLKTSASPNEAAVDGTTALMVAAQTGHRQVGKRLLLHRANMNMKNCAGNTPLMIALRSSHARFADWLIDQGADILCRNANLEDARDIAAVMGMDKLWEKLDLRAQVLEAGEDQEGHFFH